MGAAVEVYPDWQQLSKVSVRGGSQPYLGMLLGGELGASACTAVALTAPCPIIS